MRASLWIIAPTVGWIALGQTGLVSRDVFSAGSLVVALVLFLCAAPFSVIVRLDRFFIDGPLVSTATSLAVAVLCVCANFALIGVVRFWWRAFRGLPVPKSPPADGSGQRAPAAAEKNPTNGWKH